MSEITRGVIGMPFELAMGSELSRRQFYQVAREVFASNEALQGLYQMHKETETREMRDLKAENAKLRHGVKGDYDLDAWLEWFTEKAKLQYDCQVANSVVNAQKSEISELKGLIKGHVEALQRIGAALDLPAGSDLHECCAPEIFRLKGDSQ